MFNGIVFNTGKIVLVKKDTSSIVINVKTNLKHALKRNNIPKGMEWILK